VLQAVRILSVLHSPPAEHSQQPELPRSIAEHRQRAFRISRKTLAHHPTPRRNFDKIQP
jgi:hypothetical protein